MTKLGAMAKPSDLFDNQDNVAGVAHILAQRVLQTNAPSIRGSLDPRRPHAVHDNLTVRPKSVSAQAVGGSPAAPTNTSTYSPRSNGVFDSPRQQPSYPTPNTPYRPPNPNYTYTSPIGQQMYGTATVPAAHTTPYRPPLAGPSGLRQSFGPIPSQSPQYAQR